MAARAADLAPGGRFRDRREAGRYLSPLLRQYADRRDVVVLALPRGGVPVAYEVAVALGAPLDVFAVRKLGVPGHEELAMGAVASGGGFVVNDDVVDALHITRGDFERVAESERNELHRRESLYRDSRPYPALEDKTILLIDDGLATGASMIVAVRALRRSRPAKVIVVVPVAPCETCSALREVADDAVCFITPERFGGVGAWYDDFSQVSDEEVRTLLDRAYELRLS